MLQMERKILEINDLVSKYLGSRLETDFGVNMKGLDIAAIEVDKEAEGYAELKKLQQSKHLKQLVLKQM